MEDLSLLPKRIVTLPNYYSLPRWEVECKDGGYNLKALGTPTAVKGGSNEIVAILAAEIGGRPCEWILEPTGSNEEFMWMSIAINDHRRNLMLFIVSVTQTIRIMSGVFPQMIRKGWPTR